MNRKITITVIAIAILLLAIGGGLYLDRDVNREASSDIPLDWKTYTNQEYHFAFQYPENVGEIDPVISTSSALASPWLAISIVESSSTIIRLDMNHPGFGLEGTEVMLNEQVTINGILMFKMVALDKNKNLDGPKYILYQFGHEGNGFSWFLNINHEDLASENLFEKIVKSFRFL